MYDYPLESLPEWEMTDRSGETWPLLARTLPEMRQMWETIHQWHATGVADQLPPGLRRRLEPGPQLTVCLACDEWLWIQLYESAQKATD
jgi:hypothetical protein